MHPTKIDWPWKPLHVWNPIVGCQRDCKYCYARSLHQMRAKAYSEGKLQDLKQYSHPFEKINLINERLVLPINATKPKNIFVNSMSDPEYWTPAQMKTIISIMRSASHHNFLLLTKGPHIYENYNFPTNVWLGVTLTGKEISVQNSVLPQ